MINILTKKTASGWWSKVSTLILYLQLFRHEPVNNLLKIMEKEVSPLLRFVLWKQALHRSLSFEKLEPSVISVGCFFLEIGQTDIPWLFVFALLQFFNGGFFDFRVFLDQPKIYSTLLTCNFLNLLEFLAKQQLLLLLNLLILDQSDLQLCCWFYAIVFDCVVYVLWFHH